MKLFTLLLVLCSFSIPAFAQMSDRVSAAPSHSAPEPVTVLDADELTRQMAEQLRLNEDQYIRLRTINHEKLARMNEIKWHYQQDPDTRQSKLLELEVQYEQECRRVLTPKQANMNEHSTEPTREAAPQKQSGRKQEKSLLSWHKQLT